VGVSSSLHLGRDDCGSSPGAVGYRFRPKEQNCKVSPVEDYKHFQPGKIPNDGSPRLSAVKLVAGDVRFLELCDCSPRPLSSSLLRSL